MLTDLRYDPTHRLYQEGNHTRFRRWLPKSSPEVMKFTLGGELVFFMFYMLLLLDWPGCWAKWAAN